MNFNSKLEYMKMEEIEEKNKQKLYNQYYRGNLEKEILKHQQKSQEEVSI